MLVRYNWLEEVWKYGNVGGMRRLRAKILILVSTSSVAYLTKVHNEFEMKDQNITD